MKNFLPAAGKGGQKLPLANRSDSIKIYHIGFQTDLVILEGNSLPWDEDEIDKKIELYRRAIKLKPDFSDQITQEASEKLAASLIYRTDSISSSREREKYRQEYEEEITRIAQAYSPEKFQFSLKGNNYFQCMIYWYNQTNQSERALQYYADFSKSKPTADYFGDCRVHCQIPKAYLQLGQIPKAEELFRLIQERIHQNPTEFGDNTFQSNLAKYKNDRFSAKRILVELYQNKAVQANLNAEQSYRFYYCLTEGLKDIQMIDKDALPIAEKYVSIRKCGISLEFNAIVFNAIGLTKLALAKVEEAMQIDEGYRSSKSGNRFLEYLKKKVAEEKPSQPISLPGNKS